MLPLETLLLFIPTITVLVILPGPDFAIVSKISLLDGRAHGQAAAFGVALGICVHTLLAMFGISAIFARSAMLFNLLKYIGALYLFYIGIRAIAQSFRLKATRPAQDAGLPKPETSRKSLWVSFQASFLTNVLNPKAILYFMVLYPQFLVQSLPMAPQFLELGLITALICIAWYVTLACILARIGSLFASSGFQKWLLRVTGGIFLTFGLKLALQDQG